ncbi:hypothetical protein [Burkholderia pseudomallei]|nr:hypothetical protein [Burkholderia pseudomallei]MWA31156.1 hypothetical protein [Burkholderia pseudomallei]
MAQQSALRYGLKNKQEFIKSQQKFVVREVMKKENVRLRVAKKRISL